MIDTDILKHDDKFKYMLLSRCEVDCEYYLSYGNRHSKHLWADNVDDHIETMKVLYNSFTDDLKPEWINLEKIEEYEKEMKASK